MSEPVPGLSPEIAYHPVMLECARMAKECNEREVPQGDANFRSGDMPPDFVVRAIMPDFDKVQ